jgi:glycosyltransferase involved in cell wall biosynthesis
MIAGQLWPVVGGTERQALRLASELVRGGTPVEIWTRRLEADWPAEDARDGVTIRRLGPAFRSRFRIRRFESYGFMIALFFRLLLRRPEYDVVHVHQVLYPAVVASLAARLAGRPVFARVAGSGLSSDFRWLRTGWLGVARAITRRCLTRVVAVDPVTRQDCLDVGFRGDRIVVIPNGVVVQSPRNSPAASTFRAVWLGVLRPEKRLDLLIEAWVAAGEPGTLQIIGDGPERARVEARLAASGASRIELVGTVADPTERLRAADALLLPSDAEGMSNALLEAMAVGRACVATAVGGNVELLGGDPEPPAPGTFAQVEAGLLIPRDDGPALVAAIRRLAENPALRESLGRSAHARCVRRFSIGAVADAYRALYGTLVTEETRDSR